MTIKWLWTGLIDCLQWLIGMMNKVSVVFVCMGSNWRSNKTLIINNKTPTLREIAGTAPYRHNGTFATLEEIVDFYNMGGIANPFLDVEMRRPNRTLEQMLEYYEKEKDQKNPSPETELIKLDLTKREQADLVAFLKTLSGQGWQHISPPDSFPE